MIDVSFVGESCEEILRQNMQMCKYSVFHKKRVPKYKNSFRG